MRFLFDIPTKITLFQSLNQQEGNLKARTVIKNDYYIVTNFSTPLLFSFFFFETGPTESMYKMQSKPLKSYALEYLMKMRKEDFRHPKLKVPDH